MGAAAADAPASRDIELSDHYRHCDRLVYENDRDAWLASLFAPRERRRHLHALHAFALEIEGVRAKVSQPLLGEMRLRWWIDALGAGEGAHAHPIADALLDTLQRCGLSSEELTDFVEAHVFDLYDDAMETVDTLESYCSRTGGRLMRLAARALGAEAALQSCEQAGAAFKLTRLLVALPRQSAQGQVFLPATLLARHAVAPGDIRARADSGGLRKALSELRAIARDRYAGARAGAADLEPAARAALLPASLTPLYLERMERSDYTPFQPLPELPQWRRQWRIWRASRGVGL